MILSIVLNLSLWILIIVNGIIVDKKGNYAVLLGSSVTMTCVPTNVEPPLFKEGSTFDWTDDLGRDVVDARYTKMPNGDLEIVNAHVGDSGVFKCKFRPPFATDLSQIFENKLIVYQLSGNKFITSLYFDMSEVTDSDVVGTLYDLMQHTVCSMNLCSTGNIKKIKCQEDETRKHICKFYIAYEAIHMTADERCDEECLRQKMLENLQRAERILENELLQMSENPRNPMRPDMKTLATEHLITCRAGYHLVKSHFKRCFPCLPGTYSGANSVKCVLCDVGSFQEYYGKEDCDACDEGRTTETMGAKSIDECVSKENTGVLADIRQGIVSIFGR